MDIGDELLRQRTAGRNAPNAKENKVRTIGGSMICDLKTWSAGFRGCSLLGMGRAPNLNQLRRAEWHYKSMTAGKNIMRSQNELEFHPSLGARRKLEKWLSQM